MNRAPYRFRTDIEGIRALAILFIVGYHAHFPAFRGGFIGVDVFFVLSGYLITGLLLKEYRATGAISIRAFYARRVRRLFPALFLMLAVVCAFSAWIFAPYEHIVFARTLTAASAYVTNYFLALGGFAYLSDTLVAGNPLMHTWSLSAEEQFYLVWPMLLIGALALARRGRKRAVLNCLVVIGVASFAFCVFLTRQDESWAFYAAPARAWQFCCGGIFCLLPERAFGTGNGPVASGGRWNTLAGLIGILGLTLLVVCTAILRPYMAFPGAAAALPVLGTLMVLYAGQIHTETLHTQALAVQPMQVLGRLSYSWYLWHWPVLVLWTATFGEPRLATRIVLMVASLVVSSFSYFAVESPLRRNGWLAQRPRTCLYLGAALSLIGVVAGFAWASYATAQSHDGAQARYTSAAADIPELYKRGCDTWYHSAEVTVCRFGSNAPARRAVLIGDSHAAQWLSALEQALPQDQWQIIVMTKASCPMARISYRLAWIGRDYTECFAWRDRAIEMVADIRPDLIVTGSAEFYPLEPRDWTNGTIPVLAKLSKAAPRVIFLKDSPAPWFDVPQCLARHAWNGLRRGKATCRSFMRPPSESAVFAAQRSAVTRFANVTIADPGVGICTASLCVTTPGGTVIFRDTNHVTDAFARSRAAVFRDALMRIGALDSGN